MQLLDGSDGVLRGKAAIRAYWAEGIRRIPDLHFEVLGVYAGISTLVINYRNQRGGLVSEVLTFDGGLVSSGHGTYFSGDTNPAGAAPANHGPQHPALAAGLAAAKRLVNRRDWHLRPGGLSVTILVVSL